MERGRYVNVHLKQTDKGLKGDEHNTGKQRDQSHEREDEATRVVLTQAAVSNLTSSLEDKRIFLILIVSIRLKSYWGGKKLKYVYTLL